MADIRTFLEKIKSAIYGRDVRQAIYDGIRCCYDDGRAGSTDLQAREDIANLKEICVRGVVKAAGDYLITDFSELNQAIMSEITGMEIGSTKVVSVLMNIPSASLRSTGRLSIYYCLGISTALCVHAEIVTVDGHRLRTTGHGDTTSEMTFADWEWDNPPFYTDVEYRTSERHMAQNVYARRIRFDCTSPYAEAEGMFMAPFELDTYPTIVSLSGMYRVESYGADDRISNVRYEPCAIDSTNITLEAVVARNASTGKYTMKVSVILDDSSTLTSEGEVLEVLVKYVK